MYLLRTLFLAANFSALLFAQQARDSVAGKWNCSIFHFQTDLKSGKVKSEDYFYLPLDFQYDGQVISLAKDSAGKVYAQWLDDANRSVIVASEGTSYKLIGTLAGGVLSISSETRTGSLKMKREWLCLRESEKRERTIIFVNVDAYPKTIEIRAGGFQCDERPLIAMQRVGAGPKDRIYSYVAQCGSGGLCFRWKVASSADGPFGPWSIADCGGSNTDWGEQNRKFLTF